MRQRTGHTPPTLSIKGLKQTDNLIHRLLTVSCLPDLHFTGMWEKSHNVERTCELPTGSTSTGNLLVPPLSLCGCEETFVFTGWVWRGKVDREPQRITHYTCDFKWHISLKQAETLQLNIINTCDHLSDFAKLPLELQKALHTYAVVLPKTCKTSPLISLFMVT